VRRNRERRLGGIAASWELHGGALKGTLNSVVTQAVEERPPKSMDLSIKLARIEPDVATQE
jgi:hypothetical protein